MPEERGLYRKMTVRKVLTTVDSPAGRLGAWRRMGRRPSFPDRHPNVRETARPARSRPVVETGLTKGKVSGSAITETKSH